MKFGHLDSVALYVRTHVAHGFTRMEMSADDILNLVK